MWEQGRLPHSLPAPQLRGNSVEKPYAASGLAEREMQNAVVYRYVYIFVEYFILNKNS